MKILFCVNIFFAFLNVIAGNEDVFEDMSLEERRSYFGNEDGSIPEYEVVELARPSRSKRSTKEPIIITFNSFTAPLYVVEELDLMSRSLTGIWGAQFSPTAFQNVYYTPFPDAFDKLGDFEFLQNVEEGSAVTRFWDENGNENIMGVLKQNYTVKCLPTAYEYAFMNFNRKRILDKRSVNSTNDPDKKPLFLTVFKNPENPPEYFPRRSYTKVDALTDDRLHRLKRQNTNPTNVPDVVYPKLLIIPDGPLVRRYPIYVDLLKQLMAQINTLDMMFRKLKRPEVHLNIAGIILPWDDKAVPYIEKHTNTFRVDADAALNAAELNFRNDKRRFPRGKWDTILMLTTFSIYSSSNGHPEIVNGVSSFEGGCTGGAAIAKFAENLDGIYTMAKEFGHIFGVQHDGEEAAECRNSQRLEWSTCSRAAFQRYFSSDKGNCDSVRPDEMVDSVKSMTGAWLPIEGQCDNIFNDSTDFCTPNDPPSCFVYGCKRNGTCSWFTVPPMEGSLLNHNGLKTCINGYWVPV